jgi:TP53 regulating kinase-like protein
MEMEARGVDLHLMKRALQSTHFKYAGQCFDAVIEGYTQAIGESVAREVLNKIGEIERRGRYVSERK